MPDSDDAKEAREDEREERRLEYEYLREENLRLRDGRARLTSQLGPLPIGAAVVAGLVTGFTRQTTWNVWLAAALIVFGVMVGVSILYSSMRPYRVLRAKWEETPEGRSAMCRSSLNRRKAWYEHAAKRECAVSGDRRRHWYRWHLPWTINSLQEGYDRERSGLYLVQALFAAVVVLLIVSRVSGAGAPASQRADILRLMDRARSAVLAHRATEVCSLLTPYARGRVRELRVDDGRNPRKARRLPQTCPGSVDYAYRKAGVSWSTDLADSVFRVDWIKRDVARVGLTIGKPRREVLTVTFRVLKTRQGWRIDGWGRLPWGRYLARQQSSWRASTALSQRARLDALSLTRYVRLENVPSWTPFTEPSS